MANQRFVLHDGNGAFVNVIDYDPALDGTPEAYTPPDGLTMVPEAEFQYPAPPPLTIEELKAYASLARYAKQSSGVTSATYGPLLTDRDTAAIIGQAIQSIDFGIKSQPINFKTPSGFFPLMRSDLIAISAEIVAHVQACFDLEETIINGIDAMAITTKEEIDAEFAGI